MYQKVFVLSLLTAVMCSGPALAEFHGISDFDIIVEKDANSPPNFLLKGYTFIDHNIPAEDLVVGVSSGIVNVGGGFNTIDMIDDLELNWTFAPRNGVNPPEMQTRMFGGSETWQDTNGGDKFDFFIWEAGGNDQFVIQPIFPGEVLGEPVVVPASKWKDTDPEPRPDLNATGTTANGGQPIHGIAFKITDLLDENGQPLANDAIIIGLQYSSPGMDPSSMHAISGTPAPPEPEDFIATNPTPLDTALVVPTDAVLSWAAGKDAVDHIVIIGTDQAVVASATSGTTVSETSYAPPNLMAGTTYFWRVDENDGTSIHQGSVWSFETAAAGSGGLRGEYFGGNIDLSGGATVTRTDTTIDFSWDDANPPDAALSATNFSTRWRGELVVPADDTYEIIANSDDGVRVWLDDTLIISDWGAHGARDAGATVELEAGNHALLVEYFQGEGDGSIRLDWASARIVRQTIPEAYLDPTVRPALVSPLNGSEGGSQNARLVWLGTDANAKYNIYGGDSYEAVAQADPASAGIFQGEVDGSFLDLVTQPFGQQVFWRVDSVDGAVTSGNVWSYTVSADCLVVDNMETYLTNIEGEAIWLTYSDGFGGNGTGSEVVLRDDVPNAGRQSMLVFFDNDGNYQSLDGFSQPNHSEIAREFDTPQDWTQVNGVEAGSLGLAYRGQAAAGDFAYDADSGRYTITAQGDGIEDETDSIRFAYTTLTGNALIDARVNSLTRIDTNTLSGIMVRQSLDPNSPMIFVGFQAGGQATLRWRDTAGGILTGSVEEPAFPATIVVPQWFRILRAGDTFTAQFSVDKVAWQQLGAPVTIAMGNEVLVGLGVAANVADTSQETVTGVTSGLTIAGLVSPPLPLTEAVNIGMPKNPDEAFYVAVEDSAGNVGLVNHPENPNALQVNAWQEWRIDLADLTSQGVNLAQVKKLYLGAGNRDNPTAGGSGEFSIDDICLFPK